MEEHYRRGAPFMASEAEVPPETSASEGAGEKHTLQDMSADYEFFTPALITTLGGFDRDPVAVFNQLHPPAGRDGLPIAIDLTRGALFQQLGSAHLPADIVAGQVIPAPVLVNWDRRIYAIVRERWPICRDMLASMAWIDSATKTLTRTEYHELQVVDPIALSRMRVVEQLPMIRITVFGVSSNSRRIMLWGPEDGAWLPGPVSLPVDPKAAKQAERLTREDGWLHGCRAQLDKLSKFWRMRG